MPAPTSRQKRRVMNEIDRRRVLAAKGGAVMRDLLRAADHVDTIARLQTGLSHDQLIEALETAEAMRNWAAWITLVVARA